MFFCSILDSSVAELTIFRYFGWDSWIQFPFSTFLIRLCYLFANVLLNLRLLLRVMVV